MRRLTRYLLALASAASLLLLLVVCVLWVRSFGWADGHQRPSIDAGRRVLSNRMLVSSRGSLLAQWSDVRYADDRPLPDPPPAEMYRAAGNLQLPASGGLHVDGIVLPRFGRVIVRDVPNREFIISRASYVVPHGVVAAVLALLPGVTVVRHVRRHSRWRLGRQRMAAGRCAHCGYDLRGSAGRCPECGTGQSGR